LASKTVVATLPAALLVVFWWSRGRIDWRRDVLPLVPFFLLGAMGGLFTASVEHELIGFEAKPFELTVAQRILLAGRAAWFYFASLFWPVNLIFIYPRWDLDPAQLRQWIYPIGVLVVLAICWALRKQTRAPLAGALFFLGTLFPALGFVNVYPFRYSFVADHFQYLACLGVIVPGCAAVATWLARQTGQLRLAGRVACVLLVGVLATLSWGQSKMYGNPESLFTTTIAKNPDCWMAYCHLGLIERGRDNIPEATRLFEKSIELNPDFREGHANLGVVYQRAGRHQEAIDHLRTALAMNPYLGKAHYNLGLALLKVGQTDEALRELQIAVQMEPNFVEGRFNLGAALFNSGRATESIEHFERTLELQPDFPKAHNNLGLALFNTGRRDEGLQQFEQAVEAAPNDAYSRNDLASALMALGRLDKAVEQLEHALRLRPGFVAADQNLSKVLDLARAQGNSSLVSQIETQLAAYRSSQPNAAPTTDPATEIPAPALPPSLP
jgi:tetratricopeptide (TPR) repeat protein